MAWAPDYVTATELKSYLRIGDTVDDAELGFAITAASRAVDQAANRQFGVVASAEARQYTARYDRTICRYVVDIDDLMSTTNLAVDHDDDDDGVYDNDTTWTLNASDGFYLLPVNAADKSLPWTQIVWRSDAAVPTLRPGGVQVTAVFGWTAVPSTVKQATLLQAARFFQRRNAPFGVAGSPDMGSELRLLAQVDPDVRVALKPYVRQWGAA